ncbi:MAG: hypothetical protein EKK48_02810 [Candidatus Melainabacteria bacterium]|nr:MAG: hypothetical protein EKK48_02810 [Candidatus Melainabacteria bacterium]
MKSKNVVVSLAVLAALASCSQAQAQIGGAPASGDTYTSAGDTGNMGQTDYLNTGKEAFQIHRGDTQNYVSPNTAYPAANDHSSFQTPQVRPMVNAGIGGLNQVSTAPMATGSTSIDNTPFPSGSFNYGFKNAPIQPYKGAYRQTGSYGGMLPNVSLGSVDFNTVDTSGVAPVGMGSPGRGMGAPIGRPVVTMPPMPSSTSSTMDTLNWLQNSFFGF